MKTFLFFQDVIKTKTRDAVLSLNDLLKSTSDENQSIDVRYKTADILSNGSLRSLLWDPSRQLGWWSYFNYIERFPLSSFLILKMTLLH